MASMPPDGRIRILIADDHRLFAESLMVMLGEDERVVVVGLAANGQEAVELAMELQPDVILMDLRMPILDGFEATRQIREAGSNARILILTGTDAGIGWEDAARVGASGYLRKDHSAEELRRVVLELASLATVLGGHSA
jgi:DNA-binding NarL/FixJ family response regulator